MDNIFFGFSMLFYLGTFYLAFLFGERNTTLRDPSSVLHWDKHLIPGINGGKGLVRTESLFFRPENLIFPDFLKEQDDKLIWVRKE
jgi:hypothetical protein